MSVDLPPEQVSVDAARVSVEEARRITERLRTKVLHIREQMDGLGELIARAKTGQVWQVLGYKSWTAYVAEVMGEQPMRLPREQRRELVSYLAGEGMSTRAIAPVIGTDQSTVVRDVQATDANASVEQPQSGSAEIAAPEELYSSAPAPIRPATVVSLDGRIRPASQPAPAVDRQTGEITPTAPSVPRRKPWRDLADVALLKLDAAIAAVEAAVSDDRFTTHKNEAVKFRHGLAQTKDALADALQQFKEN